MMMVWTTALRADLRTRLRVYPLRLLEAARLRAFSEHRVEGERRRELGARGPYTRPRYPRTACVYER
jgi:hypothetical protein